MNDDYLNNPELLKLYEFHLYDVVCKECRWCNSGSHDWDKIPHKNTCSLYKGVV